MCSIAIVVLASLACASNGQGKHRNPQKGEHLQSQEAECLTLPGEELAGRGLLQHANSNSRKNIGVHSSLENNMTENKVTENGAKDANAGAKAPAPQPPGYPGGPPGGFVPPPGSGHTYGPQYGYGPPPGPPPGYPGGPPRPPGYGGYGGPPPGYPGGPPPGYGGYGGPPPGYGAPMPTREPMPTMPPGYGEPQMMPTTTTEIATTTTTTPDSMMLVMRSGGVYCAHVQYENTLRTETASSGQADCASKCLASPDCVWMSFWETGDSNWCRLSDRCSTFSQQPWHTISIYQKSSGGAWSNVYDGYSKEASTGNEYCGESGKISESESAGLLDCELRCDGVSIRAKYAKKDDEICQYISFWATGGVNWCRLSNSCDVKATDWHTVSIHKRNP